MFNVDNLLGSLGIAPTRDCTHFLKILFVVAGVGFYSYYINQIKKENCKKKVKFYAYKKNLILFLKSGCNSVWVQFHVYQPSSNFKKQTFERVIERKYTKQRLERELCLEIFKTQIVKKNLSYLLNQTVSNFWFGSYILPWSWNKRDTVFHISGIFQFKKIGALFKMEPGIAFLLSTFAIYSQFLFTIINLLFFCIGNFVLESSIIQNIMY